MPWRTVQQGECLNSIAKDEGFQWQTLWNAPENASLKQLRKNPDVLLDGDRLFIPDKQLKQFDAATEARYKFKRKDIPAKLRLRLLDPSHKPRKNCRYSLTVGSQTFSGSTDADGLLVHPIPPDATSGFLDLFLPDNKTIRYNLRLGHLNPTEDLSGTQHRLRNLGYNVPDDTAQLDNPTISALKRFQQKYNLPVTGEPDQSTIDKLKEVHGQ